MQNRVKQLGLSLIELMIAMALGAFLILGVVSVFVATKDSSQVETSLARLQENGRIAMDLITADLRNAYYLGCGSNAGFIDVMATDFTWSPMNGYEYLSSGFSPALPTDLNDSFGTGSATGAVKAREGSDIIYMTFGATLPMTSSAGVTAASTDVDVASNPNPGCITQGDYVIIASCAVSKLFEVTNTPTCGAATDFAFDNSKNTPASLGVDFATGAELLQAFQKAWFVGDTGRRRTAANIPVMALHAYESGTVTEMVEGVEYLQLLYGVRTSSGNLRYVPADDVSINFVSDDVVSIRVAMLMQSYEPVLDAPDTAQYAVLDEAIGSTGTTYTHNGDMTLRRVFQTTVQLKN